MAFSTKSSDFSIAKHEMVDDQFVSDIRRLRIGVITKVHRRTLWGGRQTDRKASQPQTHSFLVVIT